jgi:hypothetical protein
MLNKPTREQEKAVVGGDVDGVWGPVATPIETRKLYGVETCACPVDVVIKRADRRPVTGID